MGIYTTVLYVYAIEAPLEGLLYTPFRSGCYWLLGLAGGDGVSAGAEVIFKICIRFFQIPSSKTVIDPQEPLSSSGLQSLL
jgi:hypothetical protein